MAEEKKVKKDHGKWFREGTVILCSLLVGACIWIFDAVSLLAVDTLIGLFA